MAIVINGSTGISATESSSVLGDGAVEAADLTNPNVFMGRNRIINGDMRIDQRNAGASVSIGSTYTLDRWVATAATAGAGVFSVQQVTDAPVGFTHSSKITVTTPQTTFDANDRFLFRQAIEGNNIADFSFGTASAKTITLSFWVNSSVTGTFGGSFQNASRSYPFSYTISSANTWEYKTITVTGSTDGTWLTDTGVGLRVHFSIGAGANYLGTAGSWSTNNLYQGSTGQTNLIATNGATWYITGVQLEVGSVATEFERRPYGTELSLCQRYYQKSYNIGVAPGTATTTGQFNHNFLNLGNYGNVVQRFGVPMRTSPTMSVYDGTTGASGTIRYWDGSAETTRTSNFALSASEQQLNMADDTFNHTNIVFQWTASAEL